MEEKNYDDILYMPHPTSRKHPRMSSYIRAAQFSPFAALTGHDEAVKETARLTNERMELDEDEKSMLDKKIQVILAHLKDNPEVTITYFFPDEKKEGGTYLTCKGYIKKMDAYKKQIIMRDLTEINIEDICDIDCELLGDFEFL